MSVAESAKQVLITSIHTLNSSIEVGTQTAIATGKTVETVGKTAEALGNIVETNTDNANKLTTAATKLTVETAATTQKFVKAIGDNSEELTNAASGSAVESLTTLTEQLKNTNDITTTLMKTTNESLKKSSEYISGSIGDVTNVAYTLTNTALQTFKFSSVVVGTILNVLTAPFERIQNKIAEIKKRKDLPQNKFDTIRNEYKNNYNTMSKNLQDSFVGQINNIIKNANNLLNLYKKLGCKNGYFGFKCSDEIQTKISAIEFLYKQMNAEKDKFKTNIRTVFDKFLPEWTKTNLVVNETNLDEKLNEVGENIIHHQNEIITEATHTLNETIKIFNEKYLKTVQIKIDELTNSVVNASINTQTQDVVKSDELPTQEQAAGGKKMRKSRQTQRNKKSKKSKTRRSK